jgi:hypothetical protein
MLDDANQSAVIAEFLLLKQPDQVKRFGHAESQKAKSQRPPLSAFWGQVASLRVSSTSLTLPRIHAHRVPQQLLQIIQLPVHPNLLHNFQLSVPGCPFCRNGVVRRSPGASILGEFRYALCTRSRGARWRASTPRRLGRPLPAQAVELPVLIGVNCAISFKGNTNKRGFRLFKSMPSFPHRLRK